MTFYESINIEWEKMKKQTYDLEERLLEERMNIEHRMSNEKKDDEASVSS